MAFKRSRTGREESSSRRDRGSRRERGGGSDVMAGLFKEAQKASLEQKSGGNFISWKDMEDGNVVLVCLNRAEFAEKTVKAKDGKKYDFRYLESDRAKVIDMSQKVKKLLTSHKGDDGNFKYVEVTRNDKLEDKIEDALEDGATCMLLNDHEFVEYGRTGYHSVAVTFGDDNSNIRKVLDKE